MSRYSPRGATKVTDKILDNNLFFEARIIFNISVFSFHYIFKLIFSCCYGDSDIFMERIFRFCLILPIDHLLKYHDTVLRHCIRIGSTPTFLYFDLYLYSAYQAHYVYELTDLI